MARYLQILLNKPVAGQEAEFNDWYDRQHLPDALKVPGIVAAQRYRVRIAAPARDGMPAWQYAAAYEIETDDLQATLGEATKRAGTPAMPVSGSLDRGSVLTIVLEPVGPRVTAKQE